jgi:hypothetical protein
MAIPVTDTSWDPFVNLLLSQVSAWCEEIISRRILSASYSEFHSGDNTDKIRLYQYPVTAIAEVYQNNANFYGTGTGTTTIAAASNGVALPTTTITVADASTFETSGTLAIGTNPFWGFVAYTGISGNTFTGCTGGSGTLATGAAVNSVTLLVPGEDYCLVVDQPDGSSRQGVLQRVNNVWPKRLVRTWDMLSPFYLNNIGDVQVNYTAGYATVPKELSLVAELIISMLKSTMPWGGRFLQGESYEERSVSYALMRLDLPYMAQAMLSRYRRIRF